jgi:hypothetical protein
MQQLLPGGFLVPQSGRKGFCASAVFILATAALLAHSAFAADGPSACASSPKLVGACFTVHGRLSLWNGSPAFRIWPIGTKRMLGVNGADDDPDAASPIPDAVARLRATDFTQVYGDYRVCPFSRSKSGHMQFVCIDSASNLSAREP